MTMRTILGGVVGGVVLFIWGAISHMVLPLGEVGIKTLPNEEPVLAAMQANLSEPGFYFFPGYEEGPGMTAEQRQTAEAAWKEKYRQGPNGILIYHPQGTQPLSPRQLGTELVSDIAAALVVAFLLTKAVGGLAGFGRRVLFVALFGLFSGFNAAVPYWNWYGFPTDYTLATFADEIIGWAVVGLVLATIVRSRSS